MPDDRREAFASYLNELHETGEAQGRLYVQHREGGERVIAFRNKLIQVEGAASRTCWASASTSPSRCWRRTGCAR